MLRNLSLSIIALTHMTSFAASRQPLTTADHQPQLFCQVFDAKGLPLLPETTISSMGPDFSQVLETESAIFKYRAEFNEETTQVFLTDKRSGAQASATKNHLALHELISVSLHQENNSEADLILQCEVI